MCKIFYTSKEGETVWPISMKFGRYIGPYQAAVRLGKLFLRTLCCLATTEKPQKYRYYTLRILEFSSKVAEFGSVVSSMGDGYKTSF